MLFGGRGLGDAVDPFPLTPPIYTDTGSAPTVAQIQAIAVRNGVDPNDIATLAAQGADVIQLMAVAQKTTGAAQQESFMEALNSGAYTGTAGATPAAAASPSGSPASWFSQDGLGLGHTNTTYLLVGFGGLIGLSFLKKLL